jgi:hypothetical protein
MIYQYFHPHLYPPPPRGEFFNKLGCYNPQERTRNDKITEGQPKNRASSFDNRTSIYGERLVLTVRPCSPSLSEVEGSEVEGSRTIRASLPINETKQFTRETII